jgi:acyl-CoA thioester hydrolase
MADDTLPLTDRKTFRIWTQDKLRYVDTDRQGHVNNAVFATFFESGRVAFLYDPKVPLAPAGCEFVIARLVIDFRAELRWPGVVDIGSVVTSVGRSSIIVGQGVFEGDTCAATGETVVVLTDATTRRATPLTDELRARFAELSSL